MREATREALEITVGLVIVVPVVMLIVFGAGAALNWIASLL